MTDLQLTASPTFRLTDFVGYLPDSQVANLVRVIQEHYTPYGPVRKGTVWTFSKLQSPSQLDLTYKSTVLPPKQAYRPTTETVLEFSKGRVHEPVALNHEKPIALIGMTPCDLRALALLDNVYATQGMDPYFARQREGAFTVVRTCTDPRESCFCTLTGGSPGVETGFDIRLVPTDGGYLITTGSQKGRTVVTKLNMVPPAEDLVRRAQAGQDRATILIERQNSVYPQPQLTPAEANELLEHPEWEAVAAQCMGCGACTTVCPTCFCYDMVDEASLDGSQVTRSRRWDSCLYEKFALMAGHPGGPKIESRLRQRLYHKWVFFNEQFGEPGCVGCGRCVDTCTAQLDPRQLLQRFRGEKHDLV